MKEFQIFFYLLSFFLTACQQSMQVNQQESVSALGLIPGRHYQPRGVGGGGAMAGFSMSPYNSNLWFIGTDMGTLFRSPDRGRTWQGLDHAQVTYSSDLSVANPVGFNPDGVTVFFASGGRDPKRSTDTGITFSPISIPLKSTEHIRYWISHSSNENLVLVATNQGLYRSLTKGTSWSSVTGVSGNAKGSFIDLVTGHIYHATDSRIYRSVNGGQTFLLYRNLTGTIRAFAGGRDTSGLTLAYLDNDGNAACSWATESATRAACGYVHVSRNSGPFSRTTQYGGAHLVMAENDSQTIYVTADRSWENGYGTKVWISRDAGVTFTLKLHQYNWDVIPYEIWPYHLMERSAPGLDRGYWDNGYYSFAVNQRNSAMAGGSENFFLHVTENHGDFWRAPFTVFADTGLREKGKRWRSNGLEVTSILKMKAHPDNPKLMYFAVADISGMVSEDGGRTFRITSTGYNTNYDYAFIPGQPNVALAAVGEDHDFPIDGYGDYMRSEGGVYKTTDKGRTWTRLTPDNRRFNRQFLSIAYDPLHSVIYAGSQGDGVARSRDGGATWEYITAGMPSSPKIISQIEVDPLNGDVYALLCGDSPDYSNHARTGIYRLAWGSSRWTLLRKTVNRPAGVDPSYNLWNYPTAFGIDLSPGGNRSVLWLADQERNGAWMATGIWKSTDGGTTWNRLTQFTRPMNLTIDKQNPDRVYASGLYETDGSWGKGGAMYTTDGGTTWKKNNRLHLKANLYNTVIDPNDPNKVFYLFFGGGILYGNRPN